MSGDGEVDVRAVAGTAPQDRWIPEDVHEVALQCREVRQEDETDGHHRAGQRYDCSEQPLTAKTSMA